MATSTGVTPAAMANSTGSMVPYGSRLSMSACKNRGVPACSLFPKGSTARVEFGCSGRILCWLAPPSVNLLGT